MGYSCLLMTREHINPKLSVTITHSDYYISYKRGFSSLILAMWAYHEKMFRLCILHRTVTPDFHAQILDRLIPPALEIDYSSAYQVIREHGTSQKLKKGHFPLTNVTKSLCRSDRVTGRNHDGTEKGKRRNRIRRLRTRIYHHHATAGFQTTA